MKINRIDVSNLEENVVKIVEALNQIESESSDLSEAYLNDCALILKKYLFTDKDGKVITAEEAKTVIEGFPTEFEDHLKTVFGSAGLSALTNIQTSLKDQIKNYDTVENLQEKIQEPLFNNVDEEAVVEYNQLKKLAYKSSVELAAFIETDSAKILALETQKDNFDSKAKGEITPAQDGFILSAHTRLFTKEGNVVKSQKSAIKDAENSKKSIEEEINKTKLRLLVAVGKLNQITPMSYEHTALAGQYQKLVESYFFNAEAEDSYDWVKDLIFQLDLDPEVINFENLQSAGELTFPFFEKEEPAASMSRTVTSGVSMFSATSKEEPQGPKTLKEAYKSLREEDQSQEETPSEGLQMS